MGHLPFLIVHGAVVAKVLVVALAAVALAAIWWRRKRRETKRTRWAVERLELQATGLVAGPATLRGKLAGHAVTLSPPEGTAGTPLSQRSDKLVVDIGGELVELRGDIIVHAGSTVTAGWRKPPDGTPAELAKELVGGRRRLYRVGDGDEVLVAGVLAQRANDQGGDYRDTAGGWVLEPMPDLHLIEIAATRPMVRTAALGPVRAVAIVALCGAGAYGVARETGSIAGDRAHRAMHGERHQGGGFGVALQLAAALPGSRKEALGIADDVINYRLPHDAATEALRVEIAELLHGCEGKAEVLLSEEHFEEVVDVARACKVRDSGAIALAALGRFDEALPLATRPKDRAVIAIAAGKWQEAASAFDAIANDWSHDTQSTGDDALIVAENEQRARCLAEYARLHTGDTGATARMQAIVAKDDATTCRILLALGKTGDERIAGLHDAQREKRFAFETSVARDLERVFVPESEGYITAAGLALEQGEYVPGDVLLAPWAFELRDAGTPDRPIVIARMSVIDLMHGDVKRALARLDEADAAVPDGATHTHASIAELRDLVRLHTPATDLTPDLDDPVLALRTGKLPAAAEMYAYACRDDLRRALATAAAGDGGPLAALFPRCDIYTMMSGMLLAVVPRVTQHREELAAALQLFRDEYPSDLDGLPNRWIARAMSRRDLLRLVGDEASATRWQQILDRQLAVLADHDRLVALLLVRP